MDDGEVDGVDDSFTGTVSVWSWASPSLDVCWSASGALTETFITTF